MCSVDSSTNSMRSLLCLHVKYARTFSKRLSSNRHDATVGLINGASLTLTSIGRFLPGQAQVKNKIKCVYRLLWNEALKKDISMIFIHIISMLSCKLSLCVIAVDWNGYPFVLQGRGRRLTSVLRLMP